MKNISTDLPLKKVDHKIIGLFNIIEKKNILLELQLPQTMKIHNVFHSNLLWKASIDLLTGQVNKPALPVIIKNKEKWEVENIFDTKSYQGKIQYWIKWTSWDMDRNWYDVFGFDHFLKIIKDFYACYPNKPQS